MVLCDRSRDVLISCDIACVRISFVAELKAAVIGVKVKLSY